jgi:hypothetical protein
MRHSGTLWRYAAALAAGAALVSANSAAAGPSAVSTRTEAPPPPPRPTKADYEAAIVGSDPEAMNKLLAKLPRFTDPEGREFYVYQGDLPFSKEEVEAAIEDARARRSGPARVDRLAALRPELKLRTAPTGERRFWAKDERKLTYAVHKASFAQAPAGLYDKTVENLAKAASGWEGLCPTCALTLRHRSDLDAAPDRSKVTFIVAYSPADTGDVALAFFPRVPADQRTLFVYDRYLGADYDQVGVFRHELGHVLGYAHEQLDEAGLEGCGQTDDGWDRLTHYDPKSVMHYKCGDRGDYKLLFTDCDEAGHRATYTAPAGTTTPPPLPATVCKGRPR